MSDETIRKVACWLSSGDVGASSKFLARVILESPKNQVEYPRDPSDFGRCYRLMQLLPKEEQDIVLQKASQMSKHWEAINFNWDILCRQYQTECVGDEWRAQKLYKMMKDLGL